MTDKLALEEQLTFMVEWIDACRVPAALVEASPDMSQTIVGSRMLKAYDAFEAIVRRAGARTDIGSLWQDEAAALVLTALGFEEE